MKDVEDLLSALREHGTIDSEGQFTVSLAEARRKLTQYHSSDKARYLLSLVSAGTASGATRIEIISSKTSYKLTFADAYIPEEHLLAAFEGTQGPETHAAAEELVLGLQGAFANDANRVALSVRSLKQRCFLWEMTADGDESKSISHQGVNSLEIHLQSNLSLITQMASLFQKLRGYG